MIMIIIKLLDTSTCSSTIMMINDYQWDATLHIDSENEEPILRIEGILFEDLKIAPSKRILYR